MTVRTISSTEGQTSHYRLEGDTAAEITARVNELRADAHRYGGQLCATGPHLMPNGKFRAAAWADPIN